jgi:plasmid stabilization system protein ParE
MRLIYHRLAVREVREVLDYYESVADKQLADRFFEEFLEMIRQIQAHPRKFPPQVGTPLRRANLANFPYHVLYEETLVGIKVMVVRHHRRDPRHGLRRR